MTKLSFLSEPLAENADIVDHLAGLTPAESEQLRSHRPDVIAHAQASYDAIFPDSAAPDSVTGFDISWRLLAAARAAELEGHHRAQQHYTGRLNTISPELTAALTDSASRTEAQQAVLRHTELLTRRPGESQPDDLAVLTAHGFCAADIVMLSQVVSFISFQLRLAHGLTVLKETL